MIMLGEAQPAPKPWIRLRTDASTTPSRCAAGAQLTRTLAAGPTRSLGLSATAQHAFETDSATPEHEGYSRRCNVIAGSRRGHDGFRYKRRNRRNLSEQSTGKYERPAAHSTRRVHNVRVDQSLADALAE
jgi:hypothetical protein